MGHAIVIPLGVVIARERISHPWQEYRWRPVSVFLDAPAVDEWRILRRTPELALYHAATLPLELHRKETTAYQVNLANGEPSVYVITREDAESSGKNPVAVHHVTASPFEAQSYGTMGLDTVESVTMPERLLAIVEDFIAKHHVEERFQKRQRDSHVMVEEHQFGQEPIVVLRERQASFMRPGGAKPRGTEGE
jgi:hypothetical protein